MMIEMEMAEVGPGALALFWMTPRAIAKHVGTLTGPETFFHAYERLGGSIGGAIHDGLTHHVHILEMNGESFRLRESRKSKTKN